jgi:pilus assembly protein CpaB
MKKNRLLIVLVLAVAMGGTAGYLALKQLQQQGMAMPVVEQRASRVRLAVAARDMPMGAVLRTEDVRLLDWPGEMLPMGYSGSAADLVGRGLMAPVRANEPLLSSKLADRESGGGMPILIPEGMRAVSVKVDEVIQVAGFVTTGTRVDVLVTVDRGAEGNTPTTRVILQNVQVLAAGQTLERDIEGNPQTVSVITLLVAPDQAERLAMAAHQGRIQLALRGSLDMAEVRTPGIRLTALVETPRAPTTSRAVQVQTPQQRTERATVVETYRGGVRTLNTF